MDFGLIIQRSPFIVDDQPRLVLSNYIFELLEVNLGVVRFLIQPHVEDVEAVVESVTAHTEKGVGTKTTLYVGQEEEEDVEEEKEQLKKVGRRRGKEKPHHPVLISVQKQRIRPSKGKGTMDGWFPQPVTHNTRRVCTKSPETKLPMNPMCSTREWERERYGVTTPTIVSGQRVILLGQHLLLLGRLRKWLPQAHGGFNTDPMDLVVTTRDRLVVHHCCSIISLAQWSARVFWKTLGGCFSQRRHPFPMRTPPLWADPKIHVPAA